jgi:hypothetical protein
MATKDYFEIAYWIISLMILCATVYYIYYSPIKAVQIGRELNEEKNKLDAKRELFLMLFSLRGNPTNYNFVNGLNRIDIVFEDDADVLNSWNKLYDSLNQKDLTDPIGIWERNRTDLLSAMAISLGYNSLKQTDIQKNYTPQAHADNEQENWTARQKEMKYYESATRLNEFLIDNYKNQLQEVVDEKEQDKLT